MTTEDIKRIQAELERAVASLVEERAVRTGLEEALAVANTMIQGFRRPLLSAIAPRKGANSAIKNPETALVYPSSPCPFTGSPTIVVEK